MVSSVSFVAGVQYEMPSQASSVGASAVPGPMVDGLKLPRNRYRELQNRSMYPTITLMTPQSIHRGKTSLRFYPLSLRHELSQCACGLCSGTGLAPHSCYRHPEPAHIQWIEDGSTAGGFKWPQVLQEPPAVPQAMTATRDNTNPPHGEMLNSLADEKLVAGTGIPVRVYAPPSLELIKAMSEHLSATAFLPSLMADLDNLMPQRHLAQSAQERRKHTSMVNDRIEAIHKAVRVPFCHV